MRDTENWTPPDSLLALSQIEVILQLGSEIAMKEGALSNSPSTRELREAAAEWIGGHLPKVRGLFCGEAAAAAHLRGDRANAIAATFDLLSTIMNGYPVALLSIVIINYGSDRFCATCDADFIEMVRGRNE